jgi:site-specific recombinase XerD
MGPSPAAAPLPPNHPSRPSCGMRWDVAEGLGQVRCRRGGDGELRWYLDFGRRGKLYSARGTRFKDRAMAEHFLASIRVQVAEGLDAERAIERLMPEASRAHRVERWAERWLEIMRTRTAMGERSPNYLRELERWAKPNGHFAWWRGKSVYEIRAGALEDWSHWLAKRGVAAKTRRNVLGGFRAFVGWLRRRELIDVVPSFPEVPVDEYAPTLISASVQRQILAEIPWERRGAFLAARLGVRPGEIRAADVTDYRVVESVPGLTISRALKGPNSNAPTWGTKGRNAAWIPVDEELQRWIEWRLVRVSKEEMLRERIPLFPNPTARNLGRRWIANTLREEWNRAAEKVGVRVRMYEGTKHSSATAWLAQGSSLQMIQRMLRHADSRSTERYAKLGDLALVDVIRPRNRPARARNVDPMWIQRDSSRATPSIYNEFWRGGRDSNPQLPA